MTRIEYIQSICCDSPKITQLYKKYGVNVLTFSAILEETISYHLNT